MFTSLHHLIDGEWMREAYRRTRKDGATGIDGVTAADYEKDLEANLDDLLDRMKSGRYFAPPVRRHYIPKADGTKRPLGIPTFEDKVAQRAILMLLEPVYEADFLPCSYGFRPKRSAHDALDALRKGIIEQRQRWVIDADLKSYFDSISHTHLRSFLDLRIKDGVVRRMIDKWLKAGVLEEGTVHRPVAGTPQGGVISPILSNIFLHHVLDKWFEEEARPRLRGNCQLVRFADDFVVALEDRQSGKQLLDVLGKRLGRYGLTLHEGQDALCGLPPEASLRASLDGIGHDVRLPRLHPRLGTVDARQGRRSPDYGERPFRPRAEIGTRVVQGQPAPAGRGAARLSRSGDPRPLRILRSDGKRQTSGVVPLPNRSYLAEVACTPQPPASHELGPDERAPQTIPPAISLVHALTANLRERTCQVRNRVRQSRTLGSVGGGARQRPLIPGRARIGNEG